MKKTIRDFDLKDKKVIIRVDFNVPMSDGVITDNNRIKEAIPTILYAIENNAKVILMSHLGRIKTKEDLKINTLLPVSKELEKLLGMKVTFIPYTRGPELENTINNMNACDIILMENTRYEDLDGGLESGNDLELSKYWASLGDIFINDAFGVSHRSHASSVGISSILPSGIGFLVEKELKAFDLILTNPKKPFTLILGGSKVSDKIGLIENLIDKVDYILIGGGMAYTFLNAAGISIGSSLLDKEHIEYAKKLLEKYSDKIVLPIDSVVATSISDDASFRECFINEIKDDEIGTDIGYNTVKLFKNYLDLSETILWNGPVGIFEIDNFSNGTKGLLEVLKKSSAYKVLGGGDTASAAINLGYKEYINHISTGGGASLELLEGKSLPGIEATCEK